MIHGPAAYNSTPREDDSIWPTFRRMEESRRSASPGRDCTDQRDNCGRCCMQYRAQVRRDRPQSGLIDFHFRPLFRMIRGQGRWGTRRHIFRCGRVASSVPETSIVSVHSSCNCRENDCPHPIRKDPLLSLGQEHLVLSAEQVHPVPHIRMNLRDRVERLD